MVSCQNWCSALCSLLACCFKWCWWPWDGIRCLSEALLMSVTALIFLTCDCSWNSSNSFRFQFFEYGCLALYFVRSLWTTYTLVVLHQGDTWWLVVDWLPLRLRLSCVKWQPFRLGYQTSSLQAIRKPLCEWGREVLYVLHVVIDIFYL